MRQSWPVNFQLERASGLPLYRQVADSVAERISKGLLAPGTPLPGTRSLAGSLGVHRNTIKAAYDELAAGGWICTTPSRGTFVAVQAPELRRRSFRSQSRKRPINDTKIESQISEAGIALAGLPYRRTLVCTEGSPDFRLAPMPEFLRALRRALKSQKHCAEHDPRGHSGLRAGVAEMLRVSRAIPAELEEILITSGQSMNLYLVARVLLADRSTIAVEQPGNKAAWQVFTQCGLRVVGIPVDGEGLCVDRLMNYSDIDAVYITPTRQFPTTVQMSLPRRRQLLEWGQKTGALIIEDDCGREFEFDGMSLPPLSGTFVDTHPHAPLVYMGPFTRAFSPSVELGFIRASRTAVTRLARLRSVIGRSGERSVENALCELANEGVIRRYLRRVNDVYRSRRDHLALCLKKEFGNRLKFTIPGGDLAIWIEPTTDINSRKWAEAAHRLGIRISPSSEYWLTDSTSSGVRLGFAALSQEELTTVAATLRRSLPVNEQPSSDEIPPDLVHFRRCIA